MDQTIKYEMEQKIRNGANSKIQNGVKSRMCRMQRKKKTQVWREAMRNRQDWRAVRGEKKFQWRCNTNCVKWTI